MRSDPMCPCMWRGGLRSIGLWTAAASSQLLIFSYCNASCLRDRPANSSGLKSTSIKSVLLKYMYQLLVEAKSTSIKTVLLFVFMDYGTFDAFVANTLIERLFAAVLWPSSPAEG